jgi:hypothetical protein
LASVSGISLDLFDGIPAKGAVAFSLAAAPQQSGTRSLLRGKWEVELRAGMGTIVARTTEAFPHDDLVDKAIDVVHRALDMTSIEDFDNLVTVAPSDDYI